MRPGRGEGGGKCGERWKRGMGSGGMLNVGDQKAEGWSKVQGGSDERSASRKEHTELHTSVTRLQQQLVLGTARADRFCRSPPPSFAASCCASLPGPPAAHRRSHHVTRLGATTPSPEMAFSFSYSNTLRHSSSILFWKLCSPGTGSPRLSSPASDAMPDSLWPPSSSACSRLQPIGSMAPLYHQ
jgi:hypothetical protein